MPLDDREFKALVRVAADRYRGASPTAWRFARSKLRHDEVYRAVLCEEPLPSGGTLLDIGCGQGLMLALFAEARRRFSAGSWPEGWPTPPAFERLTGIESRERVAGLARRGLAGEADIVIGDVRRAPLGRPRVVLLFDVLQMMPEKDQDALLAQLAGALDEGGVIFVREADASAGPRFTAVRAVNHAKMLLFGAWRQAFHFRTGDEWLACFARLGLRASVRPAAGSAPFANVLFRLEATP
jgi:SAM-dependent methyltransferase